MFKTSLLRSCDYSDAYIVVKGRINATGTNNASRRNKEIIFKKNASFRTCISKINNTFIDNAEDLDIVKPMYNFLEYSHNYSITTGGLLNFFRDDVNDSANENNDVNNFRIKNNKTTTSKSFEYKTKLIGSTPNNDYRFDAEVVGSIKVFKQFLEISWFAFN